MKALTFALCERLGRFKESAESGFFALLACWFINRQREDRKRGPRGRAGNERMIARGVNSRLSPPFAWHQVLRVSMFESHRFWPNVGVSAVPPKAVCCNDGLGATHLSLFDSGGYEVEVVNAVIERKQQHLPHREPPEQRMR